MLEFETMKAIGRVLLVLLVVLIAVPVLASFESDRTTSLNQSDPDATVPPFLPEPPRARLRAEAIVDRDRPDDVRGGEKGLERPDAAAPERFDRARPARPDIQRPERPERPPAREIEPPERSPVEVPRGIRPDRTQIG